MENETHSGWKQIEKEYWLCEENSRLTQMPNSFLGIKSQMKKVFGT